MNEPHAFEEVFNRPPRIYRRWRTETVGLPEPPNPPTPHHQGGWVAIGMPILSAGVMVAAVAIIGRGGGYALLFGIPMLVMAIMSVITTLVMNRAQTKRAAAEFRQRQAFFEDRLREKQRQLHEIYEEEQRIRRESHPGMEDMLRIAGALGANMRPQKRLWERRVNDPDFLEFTIGMGCVPFSTTIQVPQPRQDSPVDPRLYELEQRYRMLHDVPITIALREVGSLGIAGPRARSLALLRLLLWQAVVFHAPTELRIAVVSPNAAAPEWDWVRWLPHTVPLNNDTDYCARMCASEDAAVTQLMSSLLDQLSRRRDQQARHAQQDTPPPTFTPILLVVDGVERVRDQPLLSEIMRDGARYNMVALFLVERWEAIPGECGAMLDVCSNTPRWARAGQDWSRTPLMIDTTEATVRRSAHLARTLAPLKLAEAGRNQDMPRSVRLFDLLNINNEQDLKPPVFWNRPPQRVWHPDVPIGQTAGKQVLCIDLNEDRHGSHGIIAGATGAGKSVLLQSLIAALAIKHSPLQMQLLLIDFKGGASLAQLSKLPHTVGFVTDLEGRLAERAMTAIKSEIRYRKLLFRKAEARVGSKVENISEYRQKAPPDLAPLPNLLIVIDEFDEMVQSHKDFVAELVRVVKQGRSLGVHLLVASQQPAKAVTDDIRTQLKYFIALRLGSSEDSREMLLKPDAAFLPTDIPGRAYFRVGADATLFQVAQVAGAYHPGSAHEADRIDDVIIIDQEITPDIPDPRSFETERSQTDLDVLVAALKETGVAFLQAQFEHAGWQLRAIWQPPLPAHLALSEMYVEEIWRKPTEASEWLRAVIGRLDIPQESRQEPLHVSLNDGHVAVIGASGSGKTMLLRTLLLSLTLTHAPQDLWCYVIDAGGQGLSPFTRLPHVGGVIQARDRKRVRRLVSLLDREILRRQDLFRATGATDLPTYRQEQHERLPAWVVVIDNIALLREEFKDKHGYQTITEELVRLARVGRSYGIHFVITADSARDLTYQLLSLLDMRIALRLPDLHDYSEILGGQVMSQIPATLPGRGLWMHPEQGVLELQVALPLLEPPMQAQSGDIDPATQAHQDEDQATVLDSELNADLRETIGRIAETWQRRPGTTDRPTPIELLPDQVTRRQLGADSAAPAGAAETLCVPIGLESVQLGVATITFSRVTPHNLIIGRKRSGKTTALQSILHGLATRYSPEAVRFIIIDSNRRGLRAFADLPHTEIYAVTEADVAAVVEGLEQIQTPSNGLAPRHRVIVVDDYDIGYKNMESQFRSSYGGTNLFSVLKRVAIDGGECGMHLLVSANIQYPEEVGEVVKTLDAGRNGLILWPHKYDGGTQLLDVRLPVGERDGEQPRGRALLVQEDMQVLVQVALAPAAELQHVGTSAL